MTRQRKILVGVAVLAFLLVLVDRVLLGSATGPARASAAIAPVAPAAIAEPTASPTAAAALELQPLQSVHDGPSLAERLGDLESRLLADGRDPFKPGAIWQVAEPAPLAKPAEKFDAQRFAQDHPVAATYINGGERHAIIDGRIARVGLESRGMVLMEIGDRWVVWQGHGMKVRVHVGPSRY